MCGKSIYRVMGQVLRLIQFIFSVALVAVLMIGDYED